MEGNTIVSEDFVQSVKSMHMLGNDSKGSWPLQGQGGKDRVSFGTNMSSE
jgi:hypothetical protein